MLDKICLQSEDEFLSDAEECRGAGQDKDEEAGEDVDGQEPGPQMRGQPGEEEGHQATDPL